MAGGGGVLPEWSGPPRDRPTAWSFPSARGGGPQHANSCFTDYTVWNRLPLVIISLL